MSPVVAFENGDGALSIFARCDKSLLFDRLGVDVKANVVEVDEQLSR